ncbi:hypothetical protein MauCBS54593_003350 [Microsporum audouinii]
MEYYAYYDHRDAESVVTAVNNLAEYVASEGPFDGVMGFSQGAQLAATLLAQDTFPSPFAFAIFICGGPPFEPKDMKRGILRHADRIIDGGEVLKVPTAHLIGGLDKDVAESWKLVGVARESSRLVFDHGSGHEIPISPRGVTEKMVEVVQKTITRASFSQ